LLASQDERIIRVVSSADVTWHNVLLMP